MPGAQLVRKDVDARWAKTTMLAAARSVEPYASLSPAVQESRRRQSQSRDDDNAHALVMFRDAHMDELQPPNWKMQVIGRGAYGQVYSATWRGKQVAVKEVKLPDRPTPGEDGAVPARALHAHKIKVIDVTNDFVQEVEVCCELAHPNLVKMLGYVTYPRLYMIQELMHGQAVDYQLYTEHWKPSPKQIIEVALGVAEGMACLHSYEKAGRLTPIIHRDLKSPNLLLASPPPAVARPDAPPLVCKVADFGLSRDKEQTRAMDTVMMTGCGSVLWMAPEIVLGKT